MRTSHFLTTWLGFSLLTFFLYDAIWLMVDYEEVGRLMAAHPQALWIDAGHCALFALYSLTISTLIARSGVLSRIRRQRVLVLGMVLLATGTLLAFVVEHSLKGHLYTAPHDDQWGNAYMMGLISSLLALTVTVDYYLHQTEQQAQEQLRMQTRLMKMQLNPHFIFNSLSILASLTAIDAKRAERYVVRLAKIYRYILGNMDSDLVTIGESLKFAGNYMSLLQLRYDNVSLRITPFGYTERECIVSLSLQVLIENAVKHNDLAGGQRLCVRIWREGGELCVSNNILLPPTQAGGKRIPSHGIGLDNLAKRCRAASGRDIKVELRQGEFCVCLPIVEK